MFLGQFLSYSLNSCFLKSLNLLLCTVGKQQGSYCCPVRIMKQVCHFPCRSLPYLGTCFILLRPKPSVYSIVDSHSFEFMNDLLFHYWLCFCKTFTSLVFCRQFASCSVISICLESYFDRYSAKDKHFELLASHQSHISRLGWCLC
jgi:hypothetical protein